MIKNTCNNCACNKVCNHDVYGFEDCENFISAAVVAESKHAKWEICCDGYYPYCTNCKTEPQGREMTDYCPNCGAKMDGKDPSEGLNDSKRISRTTSLDKGEE